MGTVNARDPDYPLDVVKGVSKFDIELEIPHSHFKIIFGVRKNHKPFLG